MMLFKDRKTIALTICVAGLLIIFVAVSLVWVFAPIMVEWIVPRFAQRIGLEPVSVDVRRIGLSGADLGPISIGHGEGLALSVDSLQIDYCWYELPRAKITHAVITGAELYCLVRDGRLRIRGIDLSRLLTNTGPKDQKKEPAASFPLPVATLQIRHAVCVIDWEGVPLRLPVDVFLEAEDADTGTLRCTVRLYPQGQTITSVILLDLTKKAAHIRWDGSSVALEPYNGLLKRFLGVTAEGNLQVVGEAKLAFDPDLAVKEGTISCELSDVRASYEGIRFEIPRSVTNNKEKGIIHIEGKEGQWRVSVSSLAIGGPMPMGVLHGETVLQFDSEGLRTTGDFTLWSETNPKDGPSPVVMAKPLSLGGSFSAVFPVNGPWECTVRLGGSAEVKTDTPRAAARWAFSFTGWDVASNAPHVIVTAGGQGKTLDAHMEAMISEVSASKRGLFAQIPSAVLAGDFSTDGVKHAANAELRFLDADLAAPPLEGRLKLIQGNLHMTSRSQDPWALNGKVHLNGGPFKIGDGGMTAKGLLVQFPFGWPCDEKQAAPGEFRLNSVKWQDLELGSVKGTLQQKHCALAFHGFQPSQLVPKLTLQFSGQWHPLDAQGGSAFVSYEIPASEIGRMSEEGRSFFFGKGATVSGKIALEGRLALTGSETKGNLRASLTGGSLHLNDPNVTVDGVHTVLSMTDLLSVRSAPMQPLRFEKISYGDVVLESGEAYYKVEAANSLLLERAEVGWCGGRVYAQAMRIAPTEQSYDVRLYCDRLNLATLLGQLGIATAQGEGTVSGMIPLKVDGRLLTFGSGFLYSSPGQGGSIRLNGAQMLNAGIPTDTPQYTQMEIAKEALKDFAYTWAKVSFAPEGNHLLLQLELDGKPANPLPFVYKKELGFFVRSEAESGGSVFQGIHLNVNFRLPINDVLHYGRAIQEIFGRKDATKR